MNRTAWLVTVALGLFTPACAGDPDPVAEPPDVDPTPGAPIAPGEYHKPYGVLDMITVVAPDGSSRLLMSPDDGVNLGVGPFEGDAAKLKLTQTTRASCGPLLITRPRANAIRLRWNGAPVGTRNCAAFDGVYEAR